MDHIKINLQEIWCKDVHWIKLAEYSVQFWAPQLHGVRIKWVHI
jgi:hypothetical protein